MCAFVGGFELAHHYERLRASGRRVRVDELTCVLGAGNRVEAATLQYVLWNR